MLEVADNPTLLPLPFAPKLLLLPLSTVVTCFQIKPVYFTNAFFLFHRYMIDNIVLLITGALHQRPISELMPKCHPLGNFEQIEAINVASSSVELYNAVLVDTPLGKYFLPI